MTLTQELTPPSNLDCEVIFPPSDLYSDEPPLETELHLRQIILLLECLEWLWRERNDFYAAGNLTIYYSPNQRKSEDFRGPDFFVVLGTERKTRKSWVVWAEEGKYPNIIIEILSPTTAKTDREFKKQLYQNTFRTPDYFWFDPDTLEFKGFHLLDGEYAPLTPNEQGYLWSQQLGLYLGVRQKQLRFFTAEGDLVPTLKEAVRVEIERAEQEAQRAEQEAQRAEKEAQRAEQEAQRAEQEAQRAEQETQRAEQETQRAEQEAQRAEQEAQRAEQFAAKLRELNIDPDTL
ncbi:Uma2 family endonuclease [Lusitaniella coriacea]|uniref:Uma2 family endonuclease n=1 Tax=Lusitaniella coriacea TaxID=1983105 RepID=UPI003CF5D7F2